MLNAAVSQPDLLYVLLVAMTATTIIASVAAYRYRLAFLKIRDERYAEQMCAVRPQACVEELTEAAQKLSNRGQQIHATALARHAELRQLVGS